MNTNKNLHIRVIAERGRNGEIIGRPWLGGKICLPSRRHPLPSRNPREGELWAVEVVGETSARTAQLIRWVCPHGAIPYGPPLVTEDRVGTVWTMPCLLEGLEPKRVKARDTIDKWVESQKPAEVFKAIGNPTIDPPQGEDWWLHWDHVPAPEAIVGFPGGWFHYAKKVRLAGSQRIFKGDWVANPHLDFTVREQEVAWSRFYGDPDEGSGVRVAYRLRGVAINASGYLEIAGAKLPVEMPDALVYVPGCRPVLTGETWGNKTEPWDEGTVAEYYVFREQVSGLRWRSETVARLAWQHLVAHLGGEPVFPHPWDTEHGGNDRWLTHTPPKG